MTASFALEEPPRHRAPAPHPTTRPRSALPPRPQQTSTHSAQSCVREAYASKDRRYSVTPPATNRNPSASGPCVRNAKSISPIRSPCDAGIGSNHSFRSLSHSTPLCTKTSSQSTELHDWNDGLLWPLTSGTSSNRTLNAFAVSVVSGTVAETGAGEQTVVRRSDRPCRRAVRFFLRLPQRVVHGVALFSRPMMRSRPRRAVPISQSITLPAMHDRRP